MARARALLVALLVLHVCGCSTIRVSSGDGQVRVERRFGFASVQLAPGHDGVVAKVKSFGISHSPFGVSVGYAASAFAAFAPTSCRVVFWVEDEEQADRIRSLLGDVKDVCPVVSSD